MITAASQNKKQQGKTGNGRGGEVPGRPTIRLPYGFTPRDYQLPIYRALDNGIKRAALVWHRRAGKDLAMLNYIVKQAHRRKGVYYHFLPTYTQGEKIIWDGITKEGRKFIDYIPPQIIARKNATNMQIEFKNNSIYQVIGTDRFDRIVGPNPVGCVFSEYSLQNPRAWDLIRPILAENEGWAVFIYTPRGKNHGWRMLETAKKNPDRWFWQILTVNDTFRDPERKHPVITQDAIDSEIADGMSDELVQQEFYCSFEAPLQGSYYGKELNRAEKENRITNVPWESSILVHTAWDLGVGDSTAIWFYQVVAKEIRFIDYLESSGEGLAFYAKQLRERPYVYGRHKAPHDIEVREFGTGRSRREQALELGINFDVVPNWSIEDGIAAVRSILSRCWFDRTKCEKGLYALSSYHKELDERNSTEGRPYYKDKPEHDWSSHGSDAFRYFAIGFQEDLPGELPTKYETEFDVFAENYGARPHELYRGGVGGFRDGKTMDQWSPF